MATEPSTKKDEEEEEEDAEVKYYEPLDLTDGELAWVREQVRGWSKAEWRSWFATLSEQDQEWWERAAATYPHEFDDKAMQGGLGGLWIRFMCGSEQPKEKQAAETANAPLGVEAVMATASKAPFPPAPGMAAAPVAPVAPVCAPLVPGMVMPEFAGYGFPWAVPTGAPMTTAGAGLQTMATAGAGLQTMGTAGAAGLQAMGTAGAAGMQRMGTPAGVIPIAVQMGPGFVGGPETQGPGREMKQEDAGGKTEVFSTARAAATAAPVLEPVEAMQAPLWKGPPPKKRKAEAVAAEDEFRKLGVNRPPPAPAMREQGQAATSSSSALPRPWMDSRRSTKLQSGWQARAIAMTAAWLSKDFGRMDHLTSAFRGDPTFRSRLEEHMRYVDQFGADPQYDY
ncbi:unnamed protein product [Symbiodinium sp. CCMP2592]|nr:unnamed protein product [Symbiodinium sp. CCMP2592]